MTDRIHTIGKVETEACRSCGSFNLAPTASTIAALSLGDALSVALYERRGCSHEEYARNHPGGDLGRQAHKRKEHRL